MGSSSNTLFSFSSTNNNGDSNKPSPPPCTQVLFSQSQSQSQSLDSDPILINDSLTLYKGRVSTFDVFGVANSDLLPGKYEGGLKLWEGSLDLVRFLYTEIQKGSLSLKGMRVLEIGCGHGLPGILTILEGASLVHFQDFNAEVLKCLTIPNVKRNMSKELAELGFFAGDWSEVHKMLLCDSIENQTEDCGTSCGGYDLILMAETMYDITSLCSLYHLIKKCMKKHGGTVYLAGKKYYFGVGGGTRQFIRMVEEDGMMEACMISEVTDGASNVREVWKLSYK
ncbi:Histidine protein methyltransferase 1 [Rhynchospora pubera]|uniref:protein-histidine N-methyltransferase n=1 Tax=Rhynchospora pubera TaxID=906938 RepID=A0AAV8C1Q3_9POAL|nr:Histidine protein methyltransferase 1 [Rhynchospora pubera]